MSQKRYIATFRNGAQVASRRPWVWAWAVFEGGRMVDHGFTSLAEQPVMRVSRLMRHQKVGRIGPEQMVILSRRFEVGRVVEIDIKKAHEVGKY